MCNSCQSFILHWPLSPKPFNFGYRCFGVFRYSLTYGTPSRSLVLSSCYTLYTSSVPVQRNQHCSEGNIFYCLCWLGNSVSVIIDSTLLPAGTLIHVGQVVIRARPQSHFLLSANTNRAYPGLSGWSTWSLSALLGLYPQRWIRDSWRTMRIRGRISSECFGFPNTAEVVYDNRCHMHHSSSAT